MSNWPENIARKAIVNFAARPLKAQTVITAIQSNSRLP